MRIVDLLKKESIQLNAAPKNKSEAIDMLVDLQVKGGSISTRRSIKKASLLVKSSAQRLSAKELLFRTQRTRV